MRNKKNILKQTNERYDRLEKVYVFLKTRKKRAIIITLAPLKEGYWKRTISQLKNEDVRKQKILKTSKFHQEISKIACSLLLRKYFNRRKESWTIFSKQKHVSEEINQDNIGKDKPGNDMSDVKKMKDRGNKYLNFENKY